ncbi:MAG: PaaI family thioesterase [Panacagrimonas sp.]
MDLKLQAGEVERLIMLGFAASKPFFHIEELRPGFARVRKPFQSWMLRPGNVISGPALFTTADLAMYALVLGHVGPALMAVTSDLNMHFLNKGQAADVIGEARLLKLGRKLAVMEVSLRCGDDPTLVAHVTGSYSLPTKRA